MLFHYQSASAAFAAPDDSLLHRPRDLTMWISGRFGRTGRIWKMRGSGSRVSWESPPSPRESLLGTRWRASSKLAFGPTRIMEAVALSADGNSFSGTFWLRATDATGGPTATIVGTITGARVTMETTMPQLF